MKQNHFGPNMAFFSCKTNQVIMISLYVQLKKSFLGQNVLLQSTGVPGGVLPCIHIWMWYERLPIQATTSDIKK